MPSLQPEYPSLTSIQVQRGAESRLKKSRRKFQNQRLSALRDLAENSAAEPALSEVVGKIGDFTHSNSAALNEWLQAWRMPTEADPRPDAESSQAIFVGIEDSEDMPESTPLHPGPPYVIVPTKFIRNCSRICGLYPTFVQLVSSGPPLERVDEVRQLFDLLLNPERTQADDLINAIRAGSNGLLTQRTTAAAVRWAIAHEMAHLVGREKDRKEAYARATELWPEMEREQWDSKRDKLELRKARNFEEARAMWRDEIACDLLALEFVLDSPFANDDLITQVCGSFLALEAIKWDGWFQDKSALAESHPSPALRFEVVKRAWLEKLSNSETWIDRNAPGMFAVGDVAYWVAFERWSAGAYRLGRRGASWEIDIATVRAQLERGIPDIVADPVYIRRDNGIRKVSW